MIVQKEFIHKLKDFGLNTYEAKLWTALLSRGISTAGELSDIANVPRSRTYDVLESLEKKGFIIMKVGKPIKYIAVKPEEVLSRVKKKIQEDAERQENLLNELSSSPVLNELSLLHNQGVDLVDPTELAGSFKGRDNIYNHLEVMIKSAENTFTIVTTSDGVLRKLTHLKNPLKKAINRGVKVRIAAPVTDEVKKLVSAFGEGVELKDCSIKARFIVSDSSEVLFMLLDDENVHPTYDVGVWVNTELFASALESLFELAWTNMELVRTE